MRIEGGEEGEDFLVFYIVMKTKYVNLRNRKHYAGTTKKNIKSCCEVKIWRDFLFIFTYALWLRLLTNELENAFISNCIRLYDHSTN